MINKLRTDLKKLKNPAKAKIMQGFFKTGKGQYGEGDVFIGLTVPQSRQLAIKYKEMEPLGIEDLFRSKIHEERLIAVLILVHNFQIGTDKEKKTIYDFYLKNTRYVNNWDLVDLSADKIAGAYLDDKPKGVLIKLAGSKNIWERRIAIITTFHFIKHGQYMETLRIARMLLGDKHDLIHKAVGWMLREVGKRDKKSELKFLNDNAGKIPRTALRYAIEKFPEPERLRYLNKNTG